MVLSPLKDGLIRDLCLTILLKIPDQSKPVLNMEFDIEISECLIIELSDIIRDDSMLKSESINDQFLEKSLDLTLGDVCHGSASFYLVKYSMAIIRNFY